MSDDKGDTKTPEDLAKKGGYTPPPGAQLGDADRSRPPSPPPPTKATKPEPNEK